MARFSTPRPGVGRRRWAAPALALLLTIVGLAPATAGPADGSTAEGPAAAPSPGPGSPGDPVGQVPRPGAPEPVDPVEPVATVEPAEPTEPAEPVQSAEPNDPVQPAEPTAPPAEPVPPARLAAEEVRYLTSPWAPVIYRATPAASAPISYADWAAAGFPAPESALVGIVRLPWSASVYGVLSFAFDRTLPGTEAVHLSGAQWGGLAPADRAQLRLTAHVTGSRYVSWETAPGELSVIPPDGVEHRLTFAEWRAAGTPPASVRPGGFVTTPWSGTIWQVGSLGQGTSGTALTRARWDALANPTPQQRVTVPGASYFAWESNPAQRYVRLPDGVEHRFSLAEWNRAGNPGQSIRAGGFLRVPWSSSIWFFPNLASAQGGRALTGADWASYDSPEPRTVGNVPGGRFTQLWGESAVVHSALGRESHVPAWGWAAAGPQSLDVVCPVFVYGTLRPGEPAWGRLSGVATSAPETRIAGSSLYVQPGRAFPYLVPGGAGVTGNLVHVRSGACGSTIPQLDAYEKFVTGAPIHGQAYYRDVATIDGVRAFVYVAGPAKAAALRGGAGVLIPSGDWKRR
ncbi:gamma-glutamylcyclotransferase family protein [Serinibacter arcticus]|nr:gamma-glutamylcyclotransferase family protein [Serinibacter arcticus]